MKVLIGYDGSDCANAALEDLKHAGIPAQAEVFILTIAENWTLLVENQQKDLPPDQNFNYRESATFRRMQENAEADFAEAQRLVKHAAEKLTKDFPSWNVRAEAAPGFVPWGVLEKAREWKPDLIVVGSHGRNLLGRIALGSTSLKTLSEAECSVRVARCSPARTSDDDSPQRIIVGIDGSHDSMEAVEAVARRAWRQDSSVRLVTAIEPVMTPYLEQDTAKTEEIRGMTANKLEAAGLHVSSVVRVGDAKRILIEEAEKWGADAIFVGARGHRLMERILLGSVSYAVAARAHCSVEVVRENKKEF